MSDDIPEIHDFTRVDRFMAARRRAMLLHSAWRPMLAGAVGAALVIGAVYVTLPKISYREIVVPAVTMRDVTVPNIVTKDVSINNVIPRETIVEIPRIVTTDRPLTPDESRFASKPEYQDAPYHGRIVPSRGGGALSFADGKDFFPAHWDSQTARAELDPRQSFDSDPFVGDLGACLQDPSSRLWSCTAMHNGHETPLGYKPGRPA